jgi:hypothetical protein
MPSLKTHIHVCAYLDVLGGARMFQPRERKRASLFFDCLLEFERRLGGFGIHFSKGQTPPKLVRTFSDNVVVAFPLDTVKGMSRQKTIMLFLSELRNQIVEITTLAGFAVRGGVSVGQLRLDERFVYGKALLDAVDMEKTATFPRILVANSVLNYLSESDKNLSLITSDCDGRYFVNYLGALSADLVIHREFVLTGLGQFAEKIHERQKYEWLARYHNFAALAKGIPELSIKETPGDVFTGSFDSIHKMFGERSKVNTKRSEV